MAKKNEVKEYLKKHRLEIAVAAISGLAAGVGAMIGWKAGRIQFSKKFMDMCWTVYTNGDITWREMLSEGGIKKAIDQGGEEFLDLPIRMITYWYK